MSRTAVAAVLAAVVGGAGGWLARGGGGGIHGNPSGGEHGREIEALRARVAQLEAERKPEPALLRPTDPPARPAPTPPSADPPARPAATVAVEADPSKPFRLEPGVDRDAAIAALLAYFDAKLAEGGTGYVDVLRALDECFGPRGRAVFGGNDREQMPFVYALLKYAVTNEAKVVDMTEGVFRMMAEQPAAFGGLDDNPLELVTEGFGVLMPSVVSGERLDRLRGYAKSVLDAPEASQPEAIRKSRREVTIALEAWAPPLSAAEARTLLARAGMDKEAPGVAAILRRMSVAEVRKLDPVEVLGPMLDDPASSGAVRLLGRFTLDAGTTAALDARFVGGLERSRTGSYFVLRDYLAATGRTTWEAERTLVDSIASRGGETATRLAQVLDHLPARPPTPWVVDFLEKNPHLDRTVVEALRQQFAIR